MHDVEKRDEGYEGPREMFRLVVVGLETDDGPKVTIDVSVGGYAEGVLAFSLGALATTTSEVLREVSRVVDKMIVMAEVGEAEVGEVGVS